MSATGFRPVDPCDCRIPDDFTPSPYICPHGHKLIRCFEWPDGTVQRDGIDPPPWDRRRDVTRAGGPVNPPASGEPGSTPVPATSLERAIAAGVRTEGTLRIAGIESDDPATCERIDRAMREALTNPNSWRAAARRDAKLRLDPDSGLAKLFADELPADFAQAHTQAQRLAAMFPTLEPEPAVDPRTAAEDRCRAFWDSCTDFEKATLRWLSGRESWTDQRALDVRTREWRRGT